MFTRLASGTGAMPRRSAPRVSRPSPAPRRPPRKLPGPSPASSRDLPGPPWPACQGSPRRAWSVRPRGRWFAVPRSAGSSCTIGLAPDRRLLLAASHRVTDGSSLRWTQRHPCDLRRRCRRLPCSEVFLLGVTRAFTCSPTFTPGAILSSGTSTLGCTCDLVRISTTGAIESHLTWTRSAESRCEARRNTQTWASLLRVLCVTACAKCRHI